jgi:hypothetical protein
MKMEKRYFAIISGFIFLILMLLLNNVGYGQNCDINKTQNSEQNQFRYKCTDFSAGAYLQSNDILAARDAKFTYNGVTITAPLILFYTETGFFVTTCSGTILQDSILITATKEMGYSFSADKIETLDKTIILTGHAKFYRNKGSIDSFEANIIKVKFLD